tara:strand:- start:49 stop:273 length:225 start_codon:yes stop_codon:yes gene_type:complete
MGSLFRKPSMPPIPQVIEPEPADVPTAEDEARAIEEAAQMRKRQRNRKGRRSTILTEPDMEDEQVKLKKPLLGD